MAMYDFKLHEREWGDHRDNIAGEFVAEQRTAFLAGYKAAAEESKQFHQLREWLRQKRDEAEREYDDRGDDMDFVRRLTYIEVLVKLSEIGCQPTEDGDAE